MYFPKNIHFSPVSRKCLARESSMNFFDDRWTMVSSPGQTISSDSFECQQILVFPVLKNSRRQQTEAQSYKLMDILGPYFVILLTWMFSEEFKLWN